MRRAKTPSRQSCRVGPPREGTAGMLSVVIPTHDSEEALARTLASLVPAAAEGVVREVLVIDAGSRDGTAIVADAAGCTLIEARGNWAARLDAGVVAARRVPWFLMLAPNVFLEGDWYREAAAFVDRIERGGRADREIACFRLAFDEFGWQARLAERAAAFSGGLFGRPVREQGLLVSRTLWARLADAARSGAIDPEMPVSGVARGAIHCLRADAVVLPGTGGIASVPTGGRIARIALAGLGFGRVAAAIDRN